VQGLIAQGRTIEETLEIAKDVAKKLIDAETAEAVVCSCRRPASLSAIR